LPEPGAGPGSKTPSAAAGSPSEDAEESRKHWAFQVQNLLHGSVAASAPTVKYQASVGSITVAVLYAAEALLLAGKPAEARALLRSFVVGNAVVKGVEQQNSIFADLERAGSAQVVSAHRRVDEAADTEASGVDPDDEAVRAVCGGLCPSTSMGGLTTPAYLLQNAGSAALQQVVKERDGKGDTDKEKPNSTKDSGNAALVVYPPSEFPRLGDTQCMLYTNLAALHIQDGNLEEAEKCCKRSLQVQPRGLAPLRTLVYILLRKGQPAQALQRLKQSRMARPA
jgi:hypothetical protein